MEWIENLRMKMLGYTPKQIEEVNKHKRELKELERIEKHKILMEEETQKSVQRVVDFKEAPLKKKERKEKLWADLKAMGSKIGEATQGTTQNNNNSGGSAIDKVTSVFGGDTGSSFGNPLGEFSGGVDYGNPLSEFGSETSCLNQKKTTRPRPKRKL